MVVLRNKIRIFGEYGSSNEEEKWEGWSRDGEDMENQLKKEPKKDQPSLGAMNQSQSLFKVEENLISNRTMERAML